ncbi:aldehyde oxidase GLOX [Amborella trichopoda]|uniref:Galactose oxidase-like Early set domain-containing protein n=1 Tax=Amborella trichopoda TaxID=13333 RepID=W1PR55_AMBTC|nr:aldehyde oxidase GLOX [Amborella trichopoda]ERN10543.1 hypothetical protein AMTR_s00166p00070030 [Amborella trichopoda]|eukprot:XP_006848962.1 aldehyde oxidase GLOX [Amborella trichopoda]
MRCIAGLIVFTAMVIASSLEWVVAIGGGKAGTWELLLNNAGVVAMHMTLTHHNTVIIFDQTEAGPSGLPCTAASSDKADCWVHSIEYDIATNTFRPLTLHTDTWCSSGSFLSDGTLLQTGGNGSGSRRIRKFQPCSDKQCNWVELEDQYLSAERWYASNQALPEKDRAIVIGGQYNQSYEFVPKSNPDEGVFDLPFLKDTKGDNLYPFIQLSSDGNLFIFANRDSILFDYKRNKVIRKFPKLPGTGARNYPSTGSSVMLPLDHADGFRRVEVMVCGGGVNGSYREARKNKVFRVGQSTCGRMVITDEEPKWAMEKMPQPRLMNDMILLPTGHVLVINGASRGSAGWELATSPLTKPFLYKPDAIAGRRFSSAKGTAIARMYHSSAILLPDGRILVAGSNPHAHYRFTGVSFPTELRVQAYTPYYMDPFFDDRRAMNLTIDGGAGVVYRERFGIEFWMGRRPGVMEFHAYAPPFATHSTSMNQRMLKLECASLVREMSGFVRAMLVAPPSPIVAPSGYYLLSVVNGGFPSKAQWVRFIHGSNA